MTVEKPTEWMNDVELAAYLEDRRGRRISPRTFPVWRHRGQGPAFYRVNNGIVQYHVADVDAWLESQRVEPSPSPIAASVARPQTPTSLTGAVSP